MFKTDALHAKLNQFISTGSLRKVVTAISCVGITIQGVFFAEYNIDGFEGQDHVFSAVQREARAFVDRTIYGIDSSSSPRPAAPKEEK